jgi:hypothetical protein
VSWVLPELIGTQGQTQKSFPLPNGETLGDVRSVGLPNSSSDPRLHSLQYLEGKGYWLEISALSAGKERRFIKILLSESASGRDALLEYVDEATKLDLPGLPKQFYRERRTNFTGKRALAEYSIEDGVELKKTSLSTFLKGEAFEQLVGIFLLAAYPEKKVIPQYCLTVDEKGEFFGDRADYRVGDEIFEIKWGGHAENIAATYQKHSKLLEGTNFSYTVISRERNSECRTPKVFFEDLAAQSLLQKELLGVLGYIDHLAAKKEGRDLEHVRDYLWNL